MKIGFQTLPFGRTLPPLAKTFHALCSFGYEGIEVAQAYSPSSAGELEAAAKESGLRIVSLTNGDLPSRAALARTLGIDYLYLDEWDEEAPELVAPTLLAFHPHVFKDYGTAAGFRELAARFPDLGLIVDTAHYHLSGDSPVEAVKEHPDRLCAIHLKDWSRRHGRSPLRIARGFCRLGEGDLGELNLQTVEAARETGFDGWLILEQDYAPRDVLDDARAAIGWLRQHSDLAGEMGRT